MKISLKNSTIVKIFCNPYFGEIYYISNFVKFRTLENFQLLKKKWIEQLFISVKCIKNVFSIYILLIVTIYHKYLAVSFTVEVKIQINQASIIIKFLSPY